MKILVDCSVLTGVSTGIATYTLDAINAICKYLPDWELLLTAPKPFHCSIENLPQEKIRVIISPLFGIHKIPNIIWFQLKLPYLAYINKVDLLWSPTTFLPYMHYGKYKRLSTVHDLVDIEYLSTKSLKAQIVDVIKSHKYSVMHADYIWCNSKYTFNKVCQHYPLRKKKDSVIGDSCNPRFKRVLISNFEKKAIFKQYGINKGFYLFVGTLEPRKNIRYLIRLAPIIYARTGYQLLLVGASGWKKSYLIKDLKKLLNTEKYLIFANYVSNDRLLELYNIARCLVSTSINEGFGMPQLEAMSCGCPVITSNNSAMTEVVQGKGITVEGWDESVWLREIERVLIDDIYHDKLTNPDLSEYNWEDIINRVYKYINNNK